MMTRTVVAAVVVAVTVVVVVVVVVATLFDNANLLSSNTVSFSLYYLVGIIKCAVGKLCIARDE